MDIMQTVESWIQNEFQNKQTVSKDQLVQDSQNSSLPDEAKQSFQQIPQGNYSKDQLMGTIRDKVMSKAGGMMGGMGGGQGGQGGGMPGGFGG